MNKKTLKDVDLKGKKVFCRVDFNVPMKEGVVTDDTRIREALPTITYLTEQGAKVILASHLGRRKVVIGEELRLDPVKETLSNVLEHPVQKADTVYGQEIDDMIEHLQNGDVLLLENVRFSPEEEKNSPELAEAFAQ